MSYVDQLEWYLELGITIGCLILAILVTFFVCYCFCTGPKRESAMVLDATGTYQLMMGAGGDYQEGARVEPHKSHDGTAAHLPTSAAQPTAQSGLAALTATATTSLPSSNAVRSSAGTGDGSFIQTTAATVVAAPYSYDSAAPHTAQTSESSRPPVSPAESSASHNPSAMPRKSSTNLSSLRFHEEHRHQENLSSSSSELLGGAPSVGGFDHYQQRRGSGSTTQTQTSTVRGGGGGDSNPFRHQLEQHGQHFGSVDGFDEL